MNGWILFLLIAFVMGFIFSNILLLKQTAKMKVPDSILKSIAEKKAAEKLKQTDQKIKKPTDD